MERDSGDVRRRDRERNMVQEGTELWKQKKRDQWAQKIAEQRELREMLAQYSPWGRPGCGAPNADGIRKRKLHLQGLFAEEDKKNLGVVLGRSWGGTPQRGNSGQQKPQSSAYKADPILRFQFNEPVRRCVDNVLRYRRNNQDKQAYRKELDALVSEKQRAQAEATTREAKLEHKLGWSDENTVKCLQRQEEKLRCQQSRATGENPRKVLGGVELVPLLARRKAGNGRYPLSTTDVTKTDHIKGAADCQRSAGNREYVQELSQQVSSKQQRVQQARQEEVESCRRHFETWQQLWGRPGHGAPREVKVKRNIDVLLHRLPVKG